MDQEKRKNELRNRLRDKIKTRQEMRKNTVIDENLQNMGIKSTDDLKKFIESIKHIDKRKIEEELINGGISKEDINNFYKVLKKV